MWTLLTMWGVFLVGILSGMFLFALLRSNGDDRQPPG